MRSEETAIRAILAELGVRGDVRVGIGDDAAVLGPDPGTIVAHDMIVEDVHFRRSTHSPADIGHLALAVNLSDVAAMGGVPVAAVVGLAGPIGALDERDLHEMYRAMDELAGRWGCAVVGGDISRARELVVGVTAIGAVPAGTAPVLRSGGSPGDTLYVTGALGGSAAGRLLLDAGTAASDEIAARLVRRHRRPEPQIVAGRALAGAGARAMMDISDGLVLDAGRLATASGCRAVVDLAAVPVDDGVAPVALRNGTGPAEFAATGGEDYELLVAGDAGLGTRAGVHLTAVGVLKSGVPGVEVVRDGAPVTLARTGWDHLGG
jgi:thiamine-monophosphate kinase